MNASISDNQNETGLFDEQETLLLLKRYLPSQPPLKDFIHHNPLHGFQDLKFEDGLTLASRAFGYHGYLPLQEYRLLYQSGKISTEALHRVVQEKHGPNSFQEWEDRLLFKQYRTKEHCRVGSLRSNWKRTHQIDLDSQTHPTLFRILCSYLDQGIATWTCPLAPEGFLASVREMESNGLISFFRTPRASRLLMNTPCQLGDLLHILVGRAALYQQYLFDQQFSHPGWSGMAAWIENNPDGLSIERKISLTELIQLELLLEIDALDFRFGLHWLPLGRQIRWTQQNIFAPAQQSELEQVLTIWQNAFEWTYYDRVLAMLSTQKEERTGLVDKSFQALFCLDDRSGSLRRHLEQADTGCETFGTPGFFEAAFFFQSRPGAPYSKQAPAGIKPQHLIKQVGQISAGGTHFNLPRSSNSLFRGWLISQTLGFWATFKLLVNIFRPSSSLAARASIVEQDHAPWLSIENISSYQKENNLQIGYTVQEMAGCVERLLRSIDLTADFAPLIYVIGHGASSVNNPHYAAYDCGACSGNSGGVNARALAWMANNKQVRRLLGLKRIVIPDQTQFLAAFHDTTRDDLIFYDRQILSEKNLVIHLSAKAAFATALDLNAKERAARFAFIDPGLTPEQAHHLVRSRSVSLFEPRPELNHATNAVCIIGHRDLSKGLFWDRRLFMNSYNHAHDPEGEALRDILESATPVCAGINLEYFFSRTDGQRIGAGSKLPHNVMGLFGVANGMEGDLRTGLPSQMTEIHDPVRLLMIVEHFPHIVWKVIQKSPQLRQWFAGEWVRLVVIDPATRTFHKLERDTLAPYNPLAHSGQTAPATDNYSKVA